MNKAIIVTAALLVASPAFAQGSGGAKQYAPGQQMQNTKEPSTAPGASEYAPGHQKNSVGPGHSESAPGQRAKTTTGSGSGKKY